MPGVMQFWQYIFFALISVGVVWQLPAVEHVDWQNEEASFSAIDLRLATDIRVQITQGEGGRLFSPFQAAVQRRINKSGHSTSKLVDYHQDPQQPADATAGQSRDMNLDGGDVARGVATLTPKDNAGNTGRLPDHLLLAAYRQQRYELPMLARFYSNDPVGFTTANPMMFNRYAYTNNNPYKFTDPNGENPRLRVMFILKDPVRSVNQAGRVIGQALREIGALPPAPMKNEDVSDNISNIPIGSEGQSSSSDYPVDPDDWTPPEGWIETSAGEKTDGRHRQWINEKGEIKRRWDKEGRHNGKKRGPHWHDYDDESEGNDHIEPGKVIPEVIEEDNK